MNPEILTQLILAAMPQAQVDVTSDDNVHFDAVVIADEFEGINVVQRHRAVYAALGPRMGTEIHALALKTLAPSEVSAPTVG